MTQLTATQIVILQLAGSVIVAVVTAFLTVSLSLRRFYREKWWEAKMTAYTDVIQALHHMKRDLDISTNALIAGRDTETEFHKQWSAKHQAAWDEIRKQIDVGEFLYSSASLKVLQALNDETAARQEDYFEHLEMLRAAVERCLPAIKRTARVDLGLPPIK